MTADARPDGDPLGQELMDRLLAHEGSAADRHDRELLDDATDLIGTRVARAVADAVMFVPEFTFDVAFRDQLVERFFRP
jgi:hypothetical protein